MRILLGILSLLILSGCRSSPSTRDIIRIGTKNFSEQLLLGEMMALLLEQEGITVDRRFGFGSTQLIHEALIHGDIDLYAEYTGTAIQTILKLDRQADLHQIRKMYHDRFHARWLDPFEFNNSYAIVVRKNDATLRHWSKISDLKTNDSKLRAGFNAEFSERPDGWPGLKATYGLVFGKIIHLDAGLIYQALEENRVDVISAFATDGRLNAPHFLVLEDDNRFFPAYHPTPVVLERVLAQHPKIPEILGVLNDVLNDITIRELNHEVGDLHRLPTTVAREFLRRKNLLAKVGPPPQRD